jgi:hypothetical protein
MMGALTKAFFMVRNAARHFSSKSKVFEEVELKA